MNCKEDINELLARYFAKEELTGTQQKVLDEWISANAEEFERMRKLMEAPTRRISTRNRRGGRWKPSWKTSRSGWE